jgi:hypothetical protein
VTANPAAALDREAFDAYYAAPPAASRAAPFFSDSADIVASRDARTGVPTFLWAARTASPSPSLEALAPGDAALAHVAARASRYGLSREALAAAVVVRTQRLARGGSIVVLRQRVAGVEVLRSDAKVLLDARNELVAIGGRLHPAAAASPRKLVFSLGEAGAVAAALSDRHGVPVLAADLAPRARGDDGYVHLDLGASAATRALGLALPMARARRALFPLPDRLVASYFVEILSGRGDEADAYAYVIDADGGRVLFRQPLTRDDTYQYRVWASAEDARPTDGPLADFAPHPGGAPDGSYPPFVAPSLIAMEGFNTNPSGTSDPWLPPGALETTGNNVDAYTDDNAPNGFSGNDLRASVTAPGAFDRVYDTLASPLATTDQRMAAVTQIFYVINWLHDDWYDSGFDEAAGNAQADNYGRGGLGGDPMLAEAQDGAPGKRNNANMSALADGASPRMQMYVWDGASKVSVDALGQSFGAGIAGFGPSTFNVSAPIAAATDAVGTPSDACQAITSDVTGKIALVDRGTCTFKQKAVNAAAAGAVGMILVNDQPNQPPPQLADGNPPGPVSIPALGVTLEAGATLAAALAGGPVTGALVRVTSPDVDGTLDNTVVAHEWGHYLHLRLVACGSAACNAESEGWADFVALHMVVREGDDLARAFPLAQYATVASSTDAGYFGIRRYPYSTDFTKNPLTFRHIATGEPLPAGIPANLTGALNNAEVHNAGEIWAAMLFEAYAALVARTTGPSPAYTFAEARRRMADYVVAGLALTPADPTYTEQRDAILAAAASDAGDLTAMAEAFARRGAGTCAVSPPRDSTTFQGVEESFIVQPNVALVSAVVSDAPLSCDDDGYLDPHETGTVTVALVNASPTTVGVATVTVTSGAAGVSFPAGASADTGAIAPFATSTVSIPIALDASALPKASLDLSVTVEAEGACQAVATITTTPLGVVDEIPASSAEDDFEASQSPWTPTGEGADAIWSRVETAPLDHAWTGADYPSPSDTALVSPPLDVSPVDPLVLRFSHRHQFEADQSAFWDGGVIEISTDGGAGWTDVATYADPGYGGTIGDPQNQAVNVLKDRSGYVGQNDSWPEEDTVEIDLGTALAGQTILLRFRIGTDDAVGAFGWQIDDLSLEGLTNTPFPTLVDDPGGCEPPIADAGPDQTVTSGDVVTLDASASADPDTAALTFAWTEVLGPPAALSNAASATTTFTAPEVEDDTTLRFEVAVSDGLSSAKDTVDVLVRPRGSAAPTTSSASGGGPDAGGDGGGAGLGPGLASGEPSDEGCGCAVAGDPGPGQTGSRAACLIAAAALAWRRRGARGRRPSGVVGAGRDHDLERLDDATQR